MNILITRYPFESQLSGEEWHSLKLAQYLSERGHKIFYTGSCPILNAEFAKRGYITRKSWGGRAIVSKKNIVKFLFTAPLIILNFLRVLLYFKRKYQIDLVYMHSLNEKILMTPLALLFRLKVIWVEHARIGRWLTLNPYLFLYKLWARFVKIIAISAQQKNDLKFLKGAKIFTVINGIDLKEFKVVKCDKTAFFSPSFKYFKSTEYVIGAVARLYFDKGLDYLINAFHEFQKTVENSKLAIVGIGPEEANLRVLINKLGLQKKVSLLMDLSREEILKFYNCLDVFILPSSYKDPFGLVAAEALACKKPLIVTNVCGIADFLKPSQAIIIPPKDSNAIKDALFSLKNSPALALKLSINGYNLCQQKFSALRMAEEYEKIFSVN